MGHTLKRQSVEEEEEEERHSGTEESLPVSQVKCY